MVCEFFVFFVKLQKPAVRLDDRRSCKPKKEIQFRATKDKDIFSAAGLKHRSHSTGHLLQVIVLPILKQPKTFKLANLRPKHRF